MRYLVGLIVSILWFNVSWSQTFSTSPGSTISDFSTTTSTITVSGVGEIDCAYGLTEVCINIAHSNDADLDIYLDDPNGDSYLLTSDNGGSGNNYSITCFSMTAGINVTAGSPPFNGNYIPEGNIGDANNSQNADGNWTLRVYDDAWIGGGTLTSWSLTFAASPPCTPPVPEDCNGGTTVCSDETFSGNSSGAGNFSDLNPANDGCLSGENESSWYYFQAATDGTYSFTIETFVDYDFAVWGPLTSITCPPPVPPIRCSYSGISGDTGLSDGAGDDSEGAGGDAFVNSIDALEDDIFIIVIDNYTADGTSFDLVWDLADGATFDCTLLPIELMIFKATHLEKGNLIEWKTKSELNNAFYTIETSDNGKDWIFEAELAGAGNSTDEIEYSYMHYAINSPITYYRLWQTDYNGFKKKLGTISVKSTTEKEVIRIINLMGVDVKEDYKGVKVYYYSDGTQAKIVSR